MKNITSLVLGLIIGALVMYFYCSKQTQLTSVEHEEVEVSTNIIKPSGVISAKEGIALDTNFNTRHSLISKDIVKRPDNRSSWWSLKDVRDYLDYAENQSKELGYTMDGVRVYLGAYPDQKGVAGYTTMFMVPTSSEAVQDKNEKVLKAGDGGDVPGGDPLNDGGDGYPPSANFPQ